MCLKYFSIPLGMDRNAADFIFFLVIGQTEWRELSKK